MSQPYRLSIQSVPIYTGRNRRMTGAKKYSANVWMKLRKNNAPPEISQVSHLSSVSISKLKNLFILLRIDQIDGEPKLSPDGEISEPFCQCRFHYL
jgi:hypothetical protein